MLSQFPPKRVLSIFIAPGQGPAHFIELVVSFIPDIQIGNKVVWEWKWMLIDPGTAGKELWPASSCRTF